jgi:hypothetical protein
MVLVILAQGLRKISQCWEIEFRMVPLKTRFKKILLYLQVSNIVFVFFGIGNQIGTIKCQSG